MTYTQAIQILNQVRDGENYPRKIVDQALKMTGDLKDFYCQCVVSEDGNNAETKTNGDRYE